MDTLNRLSDFINRVASDERLGPSHIALYFALCHLWIVSKFQRRYHVSRRQLMISSRIRSLATYHKTMDDLTDLGYVKYRPSYHPVKGSEVSLISDSHSFGKDDDLNRERVPLFTTLDEEVKDLDQATP